MDGDGGGDGLGDVFEALGDVAEALPGGRWSAFVLVVFVVLLLWWALS